MLTKIVVLNSLLSKLNAEQEDYVDRSQYNPTVLLIRRTLVSNYNFLMTQQNKYLLVTLYIHITECYSHLEIAKILKRLVNVGSKWELRDIPLSLVKKICDNCISLFVLNINRLTLGHNITWFTITLELILFILNY